MGREKSEQGIVVNKPAGKSAKAGDLAPCRRGRHRLERAKTMCEARLSVEEEQTN